MRHAAALIAGKLFLAFPSVLIYNSDGGELEMDDEEFLLLFGDDE